MDQRIQRAIALIEGNLQLKLSLVEIGRAVNLSPPRLRSLFKAETGVSIGRYQKALRMRRAQVLLETTFLNVNEIMRLVGIHDESHFVRDFKRAYGLSPKQHRAQCRHRLAGATTQDDQIGK